MKRLLLAGCAVAALAAIAAAPTVAQQKTVKIGFVSTFSGPVAAIGNDMRNSFELALDHHRPQARRPAGRGDLRGRPDQAGSRRAEDPEADRVRQGRFHRRLSSGRTCCWPRSSRWSIPRPSPIITNAGASQLAGELCSPYVFSTSWNNDQTPQAIGLYMNQKGVKTAFLIGPNYAAGKDMLEGVAATFKGQIVGRELTALARPARLLGRAVEGARRQARRDLRVLSGRRRHPVPHAVRAVRPEGPDPALHRVHHRLAVAAAAEGPRARRPRRAAVGERSAERRPTRSTSPTTGPSTRPTRRSTARRPMTRCRCSTAWSRRSRAISPRRTRCATRCEKADFKSVRGNFKFGPNHIPIQNFYLQDAVKEGDEYRLKTVATIVENDQDKHVDKCKMPN